MKLSEMKRILAESQLRLSKSLGQNFLHDGNQLRRIAAAGELTASDQVLEIGPGLGPLTDLLLAQAGSVLAIEKDRRLVDLLSQRLRARGDEPFRVGRQLPSPQSETVIAFEAIGSGSGAGGRRCLLMHDDALEFLQREPRDWRDWKMVSNLPYSAASPILVELALATGCPERMVVTIQREVAQRILANPGDKDYGLLTLLIQLRYEPRGHFKVPPGCFFPEPDVDSTCVTLLRRSERPSSREETSAFTKIAKRAFSQRRKRMLKLLRKDWPQDQLTKAWEFLELPPDVRAEQVGVGQFLRLAKLLTAV